MFIVLFLGAVTTHATNCIVVQQQTSSAASGERQSLKRTHIRRLFLQENNIPSVAKKPRSEPDLLATAEFNYTEESEGGVVLEDFKYAVVRHAARCLACLWQVYTV